MEQEQKTQYDNNLSVTCVDTLLYIPKTTEDTRPCIHLLKLHAERLGTTQHACNACPLQVECPDVLRSTESQYLRKKEML